MFLQRLARPILYKTKGSIIWTTLLPPCAMFQSLHLFTRSYTDDVLAIQEYYASE